jgi:hypothetical protein
MAFTDNCDLYGAVHEDGVNRVIRHIMRQRPSLFNYATADIAENRKLWCSRIEHTGDVTRYDNPLFTVVGPLPVLGADSPPVALGFCVQLVDARIDFHKQSIIELPDALKRPLEEQHFVFQFRVCATIACPDPEMVDRIPVLTGRKARDDNRKPTTVVLPGRSNCFCLDVYAVGHVEREVIGGQERLVGKVDTMDIDDIEPEGLEDNIICYLKTTVNVLLRQKLSIAVEALMLSFSLFDLATVTLSLTPNPPVPNNPAVEDDQLKAFITMSVV